MVHPHMRGEYDTIAEAARFDWGSPPHAWGIRLLGPLSGGLVRFTPTCVGNTRPVAGQMRRMRGSPHMRGEYHVEMLTGTEYTGSPPHAWGICKHADRIFTDDRFTPTCVGNTSSVK